jgi:hypothetical protein
MTRKWDDVGRELYETFGLLVRQEKKVEVPLFYNLSPTMRRVWDRLAEHCIEEYGYDSED